MPLLKPPTLNTGTFGDGRWRNRNSDLWNYFTFPQGQAVVKRDGVWRLESVVYLESDPEFYLGGVHHQISEEKAAELTAAGFGEYIFPDPPVDPGEDDPGFGEGGFGDGPFGE